MTVFCGKTAIKSEVAFKMLKKDRRYYYSDAMYQLEINLHKVRKELITMLEYYEQTDCEHCLLLKCKCSKTDTKPMKDNKSNRSDERGTSNNDIFESQVKDQVSPPAASLPQPKWEKNNQSPAPSTPEKITVIEDIETWIEASKKLEDYKEKVVFTPRQSLVTIESVRPADLSQKTLQRSSILHSSNFLKSSTANILNSSSFLNHANLFHSSNTINRLNLSNSRTKGSSYENGAIVEEFFKYIKQMNDTKNVYSSDTLAAACNKQNYSYF